MQRRRYLLAGGLLALSLIEYGVCFSAPFSRQATPVRMTKEAIPYQQQETESKTKLQKVATGTTSFQASASESSAPFPMVLWRFTRPHTIIGSAMAIPALHMLAAPSYRAAFSIPNLTSMVYAMIPALLMNLYITGLNQITDVEIDRINKPTLPIAAGDLTRRDATLIVLAALAASLWMGVAHPVLGTQGLNVALWGSGLLGTVYSLPPFRLKRFPLLAAFCIVAVRGTIINASFFAHAKVAAFGSPATSVLHYLLTDRACMISSLFFGVFGVVIALMKDVPDVLGDRVLNIRTFSVRIGQKRIFHTMRRLLSLLFFGFGAAFLKAAFESPSVTTAVCRSIVGVFSVVGGLSVRNEAEAVNPEDPNQVYSYYMHLWKLFYASYLLLPLIR
jgi:homogentisate phytyltransferase/homogentisate geranylgeranyltransferase